MTGVKPVLSEQTCINFTEVTQNIMATYDF